MREHQLSRQYKKRKYRCTATGGIITIEKESNGTNGDKFSITMIGGQYRNTRFEEYVDGVKITLFGNWEYSEVVGAFEDFVNNIAQHPDTLVRTEDHSSMVVL